MSWTVPAPFVASRGDPVRQEWARSLGSVAAGLAQEWSLEPAGDPMWGYASVVWPVRGPDGQTWVLKLGEGEPRNRAEGPVLRAWQGLGAVDVVRHDGDTGALLLDALDPGRDLEGEADVDAATAVIGEFIASFAQVPAPEGVPSFADELRRISGHVLPRRGLSVDGLSLRDFDVALDTLSSVAAQIDAGGPWPAAHGDLHYCNVLHTRADAPDTGWRVIDQLVEVAGLDLPLARALCQAVAVDNVSWILLETPTGQDPFLDPYRVMAGWH